MQLHFLWLAGIMVGPGLLFICTAVLKGNRLQFFAENRLKEEKKPNQFSVPSYPGKWGNLGHHQKPHRNPYRKFLWFFKVESIAFDAVFSVRDG